MERDAIDFGQTKISRLFIKLFIPTLMGLLFGSLLNVADGIFVGRGVGSDALAAINIVGPIFLITTGVSLMFASGVSVVAAIHLSKGNVKAANINVTQALTIPFAFMSILMIILVMFPHEVTLVFGGSEKLVPYVSDYLRYCSPGILGCVIMFIGMFIVRLDGAPNYAMGVSIFDSVTNIILDYIFVFPLGMGIKGAAIATSIASCLSAILMIIYLLRFSHQIHIYRPKFTQKAIRLTVRNAKYMIKIGASTFFGETALSCMMIVGNFMFMTYLKEDGVAAFSVACYLLPLVFMVGNAVAQSAQPIISYNHGLGNAERIHRTFRLSMIVATASGILITTLGVLSSDYLSSLFLEPGIRSWQIVSEGLSLYALSFVFFTLNLVMIGYFQSIEQARPAIVFMLLRGYIFTIPTFILLPSIIGFKGLWLATPLCEMLTFIIIIGYYFIKHKNKFTTCHQ
ncbi:MAG: MATE family efflux transporter [Bacteroidaceae bacterium]|nr:MATE family efflux transporter [Bacteroidaceae bacterium]